MSFAQVSCSLQKKESSMSKSRPSQNRINTLTLVLFLLGLAILAFTDQWWPGIMLIIGIPLAIRQFCAGNTRSMAITVIVFGGIFILQIFPVPTRNILPVLLLLAAIYLLLREFTLPNLPPKNRKS